VSLVERKAFGRRYKDEAPSDGAPGDWAAGYGEGLHPQWRDGDRILVAKWWRARRSGGSSLC
jgi:hypothetical protein